MLGLASRSAGVVCLPKPGSDEWLLIDVVGGEEQDQSAARYLYSAVQDWQKIEGADATALMQAATQEYWLNRAVSLLCFAIGGLDTSLEKDVLEHVEEILSSRAPTEKVLDRLLIAPLTVASSPAAIATAALSYGCSVVASILDELADLQPLLHRLADAWISLPDTEVSSFAESKEMIWLTVVEKGRVQQLLKARNKREFAAKWNLLAFHFPSPKSRAGIKAIGDGLSGRLYPSEREEVPVNTRVSEDSEDTLYDQTESKRPAFETWENVKKQIAAIAQAVSEGQDGKAEKFLRRLVLEQTASSRGETYAVKSLCNIAQQCADMFRADFEKICLDEALRLHRADAWALVQYGNYLKRVGNYDEALKILVQIEDAGEDDVAKSSIADVYAQQGEYGKAIEVYQSIPVWSTKPTVLTAIADNLRRMGQTEAARKAYGELIHMPQQGHLEFADAALRAQVGMAEIAKEEGRLDDALRRYREIVGRSQGAERDLVVYKLGLCNILKLSEDYKGAYAIADEVVHKYPFAMEARFTRGSILGLMGKELEGLEDLPSGRGSQSWREWLRRYYRGLLLLKLKRYGDAKKCLVEELPKAIASGEDQAILRMASALWFLADDRLPEVDGILSQIPDLRDCHAQYLSLVLKLHVATLKKDRATADLLTKRIAALHVVDARLDNAVVAIRQGNFSFALRYEADAFLKLAA